jgi:hypothetical protein
VRRYNRGTNGVEVMSAMALDASGNILLTGASYTSASDYDWLTVKYSPAGDEVYAKTHNGPGNGHDRAASLGADVAGNTYVTGRVASVNGDWGIVTIKYSPTGSQVWLRTYAGPGTSQDDASSLVIGPAGEVYVGGSGISASGNYDFTIIKYDSAGNQIWLRQHDSPVGGDDGIRAMAVDAWGNIVAAGNIGGASGRPDYGTMKYDPTGNLLWAKYYNGPLNHEDSVNAVTSDTDGNVYVTGSSRSSTDGDYATICYDASGNQQWLARHNGSGNFADSAQAITVDGAGAVYVTGQSYGGVGTRDDFTTIKYAPPAAASIVSLTLTPSTVVGGEGGTGTVTIDMAAGSGGRNVGLASGSSVIAVPNTVTVPAGSTSGVFSFSTGVVSSSVTRYITATLGSSSRQAALTITPGGLLSFSVNPTNLTAGASSVGTVRLSGPARSGGTQVQITPNTSVITAPPSVTVPAGQTTASFTLGTSYMSTRATRTVTATLGSISKIASLTIAPAYDLVNPSTVQAGQNTTARVTVPTQLLPMVWRFR